MPGKYLISNTTFSKKINPMKYRIQAYILVRAWNLLTMYFTGVPNQTMKSIKYKMKTSNLIIVCIYIYLVIVSALELKVKKQKKPFIIHYQRAFDFFQNSSVPFHQVIFDHSISCVLLIDEPNESYKNSKTFQRNTLFKKKAFKNKIKYYTSKDKCPNFTNFFRMP